MRKSDIRGRVVETGIFLAAYAISSVVVLWALGLGKLHQHGGFIVTYSVVFGILETLKILLAGKTLRILLFFVNIIVGYHFTALIDAIKYGGPVYTLAFIGIGEYQVVFLLGILLSALGYLLLLIRYLRFKKGRHGQRQETTECGFKK